MIIKTQWASRKDQGHINRWCSNNKQPLMKKKLQLHLYYLCLTLSNEFELNLDLYTVYMSAVKEKIKADIKSNFT